MSVEKVLNITQEERILIKKSYNRSDKDIEEDVEKLKEWLKKQPHLPQNEDETRLRMMLSLNKFSLEKTKKKLDMYYSIKHIASEFYIDREPSNPQIRKLLDKDLVAFPLPNLTPDLHRVYLVKFTSDGSEFNILSYLKFIFGTFDVRMVHDFSLGDHFLLDFGTVTLGHVTQFTPVLVKKTYGLIQKSYSDKIKGVHFLHLPSYANVLVALLKVVMSDKLNQRIKIHQDLDTVVEILSAKVLPNEYGGTAGPCDALYDEWKKFYMSMDTWLKDLAETKSDESKRIGEPLESELFGTGGSFRKLGVD